MNALPLQTQGWKHVGKGNIPHITSRKKVVSPIEHREKKVVSPIEHQPKKCVSPIEHRRKKVISPIEHRKKVVSYFVENKTWVEKMSTKP